MKEGATEESSGSSESEADVEPEMSMTPFPYQVELLRRAKERNTIVCLGTGTGKTFISVMLIKEMAHQVRETYRNGGKRTFFLVTTGLRVFLYFSVMRKPTSLKVVYRRSSVMHLSMSSQCGAGGGGRVVGRQGGQGEAGHRVGL